LVWRAGGFGVWNGGALSAPSPQLVGPLTCGCGEGFSQVVFRRGKRKEEGSGPAEAGARKAGKKWGAAWDEAAGKLQRLGARAEGGNLKMGRFGMRGMAWGWAVALVVAGAVILGEAWARGDEIGELYYRQTGWGTENPVVVRNGTAGVAMTLHRETTADLWEDDCVLPNWTVVEANFSKYTPGSRAVPLLIDEEGSQWRGTSAAVVGTRQWGPGDFRREQAGPNATATMPSGMLRLGWRITAATAAGRGDSTLKMCWCRVVSSGTAVNFFDQRTAARPVMVPSGTASLAAPTMAERAQPRVVVSENSLYMNQPAWRSAWKGWLNAEFPGKGAVVYNSVVTDRLAAGVADYHGDGVWPMYEGFMAVRHREAWLMNRGEFMTQADGFSPSQSSWGDWTLADALLPNTVDTTAPDALGALVDQMNAVYDEGFGTFTLMDYTWPYTRGRWGYGENAVAQWKAYLKGTGGTLRLVGPAETWTFADYWAHFCSLPLEPGTFGWASWDDFTCGREDLAGGSFLEYQKLFLFNALWHFHYLTFLQRAAEAAVARGRELYIDVNPEALGNGVDHALLGRMADLGAVGVEFFGSPRQVFAWRHTMPFLRDRTAGPAIDLVGEINAGGHGASRYDREVAFLFYDAVTASVRPRQYNTQYLSGVLWTQPGTLGATDRGRFDHWFAGANAFLMRQAEEDAAAAARDDVTVIATRSILEYQDTSSGAVTQKGNLGAYLEDLQINFEQVGRDVWDPATDGRTKILVWSPGKSTPAEMAKAQAWISSGTGRTLVVNGGSGWWLDFPSTAGAYTDNTLTQRWPMYQDRTVTYQGYSFWTRWWDSWGPATTILAADDGSPLVRTWNVGGNLVVHILPDLPESGYAPEQLAIVRQAMATAGAKAFADENADWLLEEHSVPGGEALAIYQKAALASQEANNSYARQALGAIASVYVRAQPSRVYSVYSVLGQRMWTVASDADGRLEIPLEAGAELVYFGEEGSAALQDSIMRAQGAYLASVSGTRQ